MVDILVILDHELFLYSILELDCQLFSPLSHTLSIHVIEPCDLHFLFEVDREIGSYSFSLTSPYISSAVLHFPIQPSLTSEFPIITATLLTFLEIPFGWQL
jgi:hypothetical protein